jgi:uroporphyrinogen-III synthase
VLPQELEKLGNKVILAEAYKSLFPMDEKSVKELIEKIETGKIDAITFTSPLTVENFFEIAEDKSKLAGLLNDNLLTVCIGPITAKVLDKYGVSHIYPDTYTVPDMMELLFEKLES